MDVGYPPFVPSEAPPPATPKVFFEFDKVKVVLGTEKEVDIAGKNLKPPVASARQEVS